MNYKAMEKTENALTSIKNYMKENGITNRQLSVRQINRSSLNDNISITQKDLFLNYYKLSKIFKSLEAIRYDERSYEILSGCNTFIDYQIDNQKLGEYMEENGIYKQASKLIEKAANNNGCGVELIPNDQRFIIFNDEIFIESEEEDSHWHYINVSVIAKYLAFYKLGYYEPIEDYKTRKRTQEEEAEKKRQEADKLYQEIKKQRELEKELILSDYTLKEIPENEQQTKVYKWARLNKNSTLKEYKEEVRNGEYYTQKGRITHTLEFKNWAAAEAFSNNLLTSFDFIKGKGGTLEENSEYINMVVAVMYAGNEYFVIDPQGYSYSRYVGLKGVI